MAEPLTTLEAASVAPAEAIAFLRQKANVTSERWTDVWNEAHTRSFMVAGAATREIVQDFRDAVSRALEQGSTLADFRRDFDAIVDKHGWVHNGTPGWRASIIYETNLSTAYSAGRYAQMTEPDTLKVYPFWQYMHTSSVRPRPQHLAWVGTTLKADDPWWSTHYPPNGWRCKCSVRPVSERGLRRQGKTGPDQAPDLDLRPWRSADGRIVTDVPHGVDPGFAYNPGQAWQQGLPPPNASASPLRPVRAPLRAEPVSPPAPAEAGPVGKLVPQVRRAIGGADGEVNLSAETLEKQVEHHPELTAEDYGKVPALLAAPQVVLQEGEGRVILLRRTERGVLAGFVKRTSDGRETYLTSLRWARPKDVRRLLRRYALLFGNADDLGNGEDGAPEGPPANPS